MEKQTAAKTEKAVPSSGQPAVGDAQSDSATRSGTASNTATRNSMVTQSDNATRNNMATKSDSAARNSMATKSDSAARNSVAAQSDSAARNSMAAQSDSAAQNSMAMQSDTAAQNAVETEKQTAAATRPDRTACGVNYGALPGECAPLAFPYIPMQDKNPVRYSRMEALETGTLFPGLHLPFREAIQERTQLTNTALVELMALDFAIQELGLYLTTHMEDQEALQLYWSYIQMAKEGREKYARLYGPLLETDLTPEDGFAWLRDPWPWDVGGDA